MPRREYPSIVVRDYETAELFVNNYCDGHGTWNLNTTGSNLKHVEVSTAVGWNTPGWRKIRNGGGILPFTLWNQFYLTGDATTSERDWCTSSGGSRYQWRNHYRGMSWVDRTQDDLLAYVDMPDLKYLVQQAASAIYSQGWDALTFLAELKQLRRMLSGIGHKMDSLTRGKSPGKIQNLWLEGRYGWRTLRYDIDDFVEYLGSTNDGRSRFRTARGLNISGSWEDYSESTSSNLITGTNLSINWTGSARGTVVSDIDVPELQFNPLTTAWEVTRLSFVVDWLLNVGQALEATTFLLLTGGYAAGSGYNVDFNMVRTDTSAGSTGGRVVNEDYGSASGSARITRRDPATVSVLPRLKLRLDAWKVVDLLSLVAQRVIK